MRHFAPADDGRGLSSQQPAAIRAKILVVDENEIERKAACGLLKGHGFTILSAENADKALSYVNERIDLVLCDVGLRGYNCMDLLGLWKRQSPRTLFILITALGSVVDAVAAIKAGAYQYLIKPLAGDKLVLLIRHALKNMPQEADSSGGRLWPQVKLSLDQIVGRSRQMKEVCSRIERAGPVDSSVLILGENGTGKELVAHALHENSPRRNGPFVALNVSAVPATLVESELFGHVRGAFTGATDRRIGRFEQADHGTLFIDEIGDFELVLQPKLLRALETLTVTPVGGQEDRKVDVRVIAATSRDITAMAHQGTFREDLYYRLNVVQIRIPPLRERAEDIPDLVEHFVKQLAELNRGVGRVVAPQTMRRLLNYSWPGNVRELHNTLESMMVLADGELLTEACLPDHISLMSPPSAAPETPVGLTMQALEKLAILRALESSGGNRTHAAERLGISVRTLQRKLHEYQNVSSPEAAE